MIYSTNIETIREQTTEHIANIIYNLWKKI